MKKILYFLFFFYSSLYSTGFYSTTYTIGDCGYGDGGSTYMCVSNIINLTRTTVDVDRFGSWYSLSTVVYDINGVKSTVEFKVQSEGTYPTCPDGYLRDGDKCVICEQLSPATVSYDSSQCVNGSSFINSDTGLTGILSYQTCDNTCYVLEPQYQSCTDYYTSSAYTSMMTTLSQTCDSDLNNLSIDCIPDVINGGYTLDQKCEPKNTVLLTSPCDELEKTKESECKANNQALVGTCLDNGLVVTNSTFECVDISSPTTDSNTTDGTSTTDGTDSTVDSNLTTSTVDSNLSAEISSLRNTASGIRRDLNTTNNLLNKIADKNNTTDMTSTNDLLGKILDKNNTADMTSTNDLLSKILGKIPDSNDSGSSLLYSPDSGMVSNQSSIDIGLEQIYSVMSDIKSDYSSLIVSLENGLPQPTFSSGNVPLFCATVFGKNICFNLCDSFSYFRSVLYYIFTITFLLTALRIYWSAFKYR